MKIGNISGMLRLSLMLGLLVVVSGNNLLDTYSPLSLVDINSNTFALKDSDQTDFLIGSQYMGTYQRNQPNNLFGYLDSTSGDLDAIFLYDPFKPSETNLNSFIVFLFDPVYHDRKAVRILITLPKMSSPGQWTSNATDAEITKFWKERQIDKQNISTLKYTIKVGKLSTQDPKQVEVRVQMQGPDFSFSGSLTYDDEIVSTVGYSLYLSAIIIAQVVCAYMLLKNIDGPNPNFSNKFSLTTVAICNIEDFYLTIIHIEYIMTSSSNGYLLYILPAFSYIVLFVVFDMKLLFLVWRSHYMRQIDNPQALRKKLTTFYIKFYVGLFVYLTLSYFFTYDEWLIILQNLFVVPQIVHNVRAGNNPGFSGFYVFGYLGLRLFLPLYERSCPANHFRVAPEPWLVILLCCLYLIQLLFLVLQYKIGPRFFIPRIFQPDYYNYNFKLKPTHENQDLQCSICLISIFEDEESINISELQRPMVSEKTVMRTPCNHYFHRDCLTNWIDVKMECPTCRAPLPPL